MTRISSMVEGLFYAFEAVLIARVLLSWLRLRRGTVLADRVAPMLYTLTEPMLAPVRRWLRPHLGNAPVDFSPVLLILMLSVVETIVVSVLRAAGL